MLEAGGIRLRTWTGGPTVAGTPAIVCVHGVVASSRYMLPTARRLASRYRMYVPDLPGYGRSDKPTQCLTTEGLAAGLGALLDSNGIERVTLLANSYGCQVATLYALRHPERVGRLVLTGPTIDSHARTLFRQAWRLAVAGMREKFSLWLVLAGDLADLGALRASTAVRTMLVDRIEERLPQLQMPTLVVRGEHDAVAPARWVDEVTALLPRGRLVTIPGGAHALQYSSPDALAGAVDAFMRTTTVL